MSFNKESLRILIVEDDEDDAFIIKDLIREGMVGNQIQIDHSINYDQTISFLEKNNYDLCMFDYRLGEVDGIRLMHMAREKGVTAPIIFLTGQGDQEIAVEAMKAGAIDYLTKGNLTSETLCNSIRYSIQLNREEDRRKQAEALLKRSHEELIQKNDELKDSLIKLQTAQNQILRSEKLAGIGRLAAGVCHEILNPLNIISGHVQALLLEREKDTPLMDDMKSVQEEILRIEKIINGLLKFSRKGEVELKDVDINQELDSVLAILEKEMNLQNINVTRNYGQDLPKIMIDVDRMRQVFLNIINNGKYAMLEGGTFTITTLQITKDRRKKRRKNESGEEEKAGFTNDGKGHPFLSIQFQDTGTGIRKEHLDKLFDPFFTTKPEDKGTGLGLSVCYTIIEKHSGTLEVASEYGKGATFIIDLPVDDPVEELQMPEMKERVI